MDSVSSSITSPGSGQWSPVYGLLIVESSARVQGKTRGGQGERSQRRATHLGEYASLGMWAVDCGPRQGYNVSIILAPCEGWEWAWGRDENDEGRGYSDAPEAPMVERARGCRARWAGGRD